MLRRCYKSSSNGRTRQCASKQKWSDQCINHAESQTGCQTSLTVNPFRLHNILSDNKTKDAEADDAMPDARLIVVTDYIYDSRKRAIQKGSSVGFSAVQCCGAMFVCCSWCTWFGGCRFRNTFSFISFALTILLFMSLSYL